MFSLRPTDPPRPADSFGNLAFSAASPGAPCAAVLIRTAPLPTFLVQIYHTGASLSSCQQPHFDHERHKVTKYYHPSDPLCRRVLIGWRSHRAGAPDQ